MQSTMSKQQLSNRDEIKVLNTLLSKAACNVTMTAKDNVWSIKVSTPEFTMTLRYWMSESALDVLRQGVRTWNYSVTNARGKNVMSASSMEPQVSVEMGRILGKYQEAKTKSDAGKDWAELEKFASLSL